MNDSDRLYLSRFSLDSGTEYGFEDLYGGNSFYEEGLNPFNDENILDPEDVILEDDFLFDD